MKQGEFFEEFGWKQRLSGVLWTQIDASGGSILAKRKLVAEWMHK